MARHRGLEVAVRVVPDGVVRARPQDERTDAPAGAPRVAGASSCEVDGDRLGVAGADRRLAIIVAVGREHLSRGVE